MFIGYMPEYENLYEQMHNAGYMVVLKPTFDMTRPRQEEKQAKGDSGNTKADDKEQEKHIKGNIDADLVLWAMKEIKNYDQAILVSGDGDFYSLVEYLHEQNKLSKILTPGGHYSNLYNRFENYIVRLDHHQRALAYHDHRRRPNQKRNASKPAS